MAPPREVIAEIDIDDQGVVQAVERTTDGMDRIQTGGQRAARAINNEWGRTSRGFAASSNVITQRLFDMRGAARVALGGFTLAGIALGLKAAVTESTKLDLTFLKMQASVRVISRLFGEWLRDLPLIGKAIEILPDLLLAFAAEAQTFFSFKGFKAVVTGQIDEFIRLFRERFRKLKVERGQDLLRTFLGLPTQSEINNVLSLSVAAFESFGKSFLSGSISGEAFLRIVNKIVAVLGAAGQVDQAFSIAANAASALELKWREGALAAADYFRAYQQLRGALISSGATQAQIDAFDTLNQKIIETIQTAEIMREVFVQLGGSIGNALAQGLFEGGLTLKAAIAGILRDMARLAIVKSLESLATGILASTPWGQALGLGPPAPYFVAAKVWGAVAAIAGAAALAVGGRGPLSGGAAQGQSSGRFGADTPSTAPARAQINVFLSVFGDPSDAQLRGITEGVAKALRDGVEGGSLALA